MAGQGRHVLIVEDEPAERDALRALLEVWEDRIEEAENGARAIEMALDRRPARAMTSVLRAGLGLIVIPLAIAGYAGITALILPLDVLLSGFRRPRLVDLRAPAAGRLLPARAAPLPATA